MKRELFGITVEEPNFADTGGYVTDAEIRGWIGLCMETIVETGRHWSSLQSGNATVHVIAREGEWTVPHPYYVIIFRGREAYVADLTQEEADDILAGKRG